MYLLYNPTEEDFRIWTKEAERETWKHIPEIKSHIAEEITLDQCVQRLRKKLVQESWEAKLERGRVRERMMNPHSNNKASSSTSFSTTLRKGAGNGSGGDISSTDPTENKLGKGQPSFFTSPSLVQINGSLVHMGGLSLGDRLDLKYDPNYNSESQSSSHPRIPNLVAAGEYENVEDTINDPIHLGWSGRGLSGNRSVSSLDRHEANGSGFLMTRSLSDASGLYMDASDDEGSSNGGGGETGVGNENVNDPATFIGSSSPHRRMNKAWNDGTVVSHPSNPNSIPSNDDSHAVVTNPGDSGYVKTSSMAEFYYGRRKSRSNTQLRQIIMEESNDRVVKSSLDLSEHIRYRQDS